MSQVQPVLKGTGRPLHLWCFNYKVWKCVRFPHSFSKDQLQVSQVQHETTGKSCHGCVWIKSLWKRVGIQTLAIHSKMSQIVTLTDVIMWRSKWDFGIWQSESIGIAEEWEVSSGGKKRKKWKDLWEGSVIPSSVFLWVLPPSFLSPLFLYLSLSWFYFPTLFFLSRLPAPCLCCPPSLSIVHMVVD